MHVLYASDENYIRHAAASMLSLLDHNRDAESITVHFLSMGVTEESRQAVRDLAAPFGREVCFYELGDLRRWFDFSFDARGFAQSTLARLFMARVLPETVDRVIYIDCDTVILDSLQDMFDTPMGNNYLGMVAEPTSNKARRRQLGMPDSQPYFNAGILLVNLKLWREENAENTVLCYYRDKGGNLIAPDQDAINGAFVGRILELAPRYNYGSVQLYYSWKAQKKISHPTPVMSEKEYLAGTEKPAIIHFLGEERPWRKGNRHPYSPVYEKYLSMTPWKDVPFDDGWQTYFFCFYLFNAVMKPFPYLRWRIIDSLIPAFMRYRAKQLKKKSK